MTDRSWAKQIGLTPAKAAVIAVLGVVLVVVVLMQTGEPEPATARRRSERASDRPLDPPDKPRLPVDEHAWRAPSLTAVSFDPFAPPSDENSAGDHADGAAAGGAAAGGAAAGGEAADGRPHEASGPDADGGTASAWRPTFGSERLDRLQRRGVSLVMEIDGRRVAVIDGRVVSVGDVIDGYRVVAIDEDGVSVAVDRGRSRASHGGDLDE